MANFIEKPRTTCSLGGALSVISSLPGVVPIAHTATGCAGNLSGATAFGSGNCGSSYCSGSSVPCSSVGEKHVVFGGGDRLTEEINSALELIDAQLFVVTTGCMTEIIAEDLYSVVSQFQEEGKPIIYVNTPSFEADAYGGYDIVMDGIFNKYIPKSDKKDERMVNILGVVPQFDPFFRGDLEEIKRVLERLGLKVNTFFTADQSFQNILDASGAALNIVLSDVWGISVAKGFQKKHGTDFISVPIPVGAAQTEDFLRTVGQKLGIEEALVEDVIASENNWYYRYLERAADTIANGEVKYYTDVVSNSNGAISYAKFAQEELGWLIENVAVTDILKKSSQKALEQRFAEAGLRGGLFFETDASCIAKRLKNSAVPSHADFYQDFHTPVYVFGSTFEKDFALKNAAGSLSVSYPVYDRTIVTRGYSGYRGGLNLIEDILSSLNP